MVQRLAGETIAARSQREVIEQMPDLMHEGKFRCNGPTVHAYALRPIRPGEEPVFSRRAGDNVLYRNQNSGKVSIAMNPINAPQRMPYRGSVRGFTDSN